MIVYAETSAVLRWLFNEASGDAILDVLRQGRPPTGHPAALQKRNQGFLVLEG